MGSIQGALVRWLLRRARMWDKPLPEIRHDLARMEGGREPEGVSCTALTVNGVPCLVFVPPRAAAVEAGKTVALVHFHGGGFCMGIYPANRNFVASLALAAGIRIYLPDYRLAPEHPFPAALDDAVAVLDRLIVSGDSSGCALALSALQELRRESAVTPRGLAFITPVLDLSVTGEALAARAGADPFRTRDPLGIARIYVGNNDPTSHRLSPLFGVLDWLPPTLVHAADRDVFRHDATRLAEIATQAGRPLTLRVWPQMWHVFHFQHVFVPEARKALGELSRFLARHAEDAATLSAAAVN